MNDLRHLESFFCLLVAAGTNGKVLKQKKNKKIFKKTRPIGDECHHGPVYNWQGRWQLDVDVNRRLHEILQINYSDWNSWSAAQANGQKKRDELLLLVDFLLMIWMPAVGTAAQWLLERTDCLTPFFIYSTPAGQKDIIII